MWQIAAAIIGRLFSAKALEYVAMKTVMLTLLTVVFPIVINNILYELIEFSLSRASATATGDGFSATMTLTGIAAYLANLLRIPEVLSIVISGIIVKFSLRLIPFLRV